MPYAKKRKISKSQSRKRGRKSSAVYMPQRRIPWTRTMSAGHLLPTQMRTFMKYSESFAISSGVSGSGYYEFSGSSIFDPNQTGAGHSALGHDEMSLIYRYYKVEKSRLRVFVTNEDGAGIICCIAPRSTSGSPANIEELIEADLSVFDVASGLGEGDNILKLDTGWCLSRYIRGDLVEDEDSGANFGADPANQWYWEFGFKNQTTASSYSLRFTIVVEYQVLMSSPKKLNQS